MWHWLSLAIVALGGGCAISAWRQRSRKRLAIRTAGEAFTTTSDDRRIEAMLSSIDETRDNGAAWYLLGCSRLRAYEVREAARAFGIAHHLDCDLESAALLTFACLKSTEGRESNIIEQLMTTWVEMKRPDLAQSYADQQVQACLAATTRDPPELSEIGRLIWLVTGPDHQRVIEQARDSDEVKWKWLQPSTA